MKNISEVRDAIVAFVGDDRNRASLVRECLASFGVARVSMLKQSDYESFVELLKSKN